MKAIGKQLHKGFTLVELLIVVIILAILAAIVVPQFSATTSDAKEAALDSNLAAMRSAIDLYYQQHGGTYPSAIAATGGSSACSGSAGTGAIDTAQAFISQLSLYTDAAGNTCDQKDADYPYGPYLKKSELPPNPMTNSNALLVTKTGDLSLAGATTPAGWKFDNQSGRFIANDASYQDR